MRSPPIPLFCFLSVTSVRQARLPLCDMKLTLFCVATTPGLLHDVFQDVSVHPHPIEIGYGLLSDAKDTNTFSLFVCVHMTTGRTHVFDIRLQQCCNCVSALCNL